MYIYTPIKHYCVIIQVSKTIYNSVWYLYLYLDGVINHNWGAPSCRYGNQRHLPICQHSKGNLQHCDCPFGPAILGPGVKKWDPWISIGLLREHPGFCPDQFSKKTWNLLGMNHQDMDIYMATFHDISWWKTRGYNGRIWCFSRNLWNFGTTWWQNQRNTTGGTTLYFC